MKDIDAGDLLVYLIVGIAIAILAFCIGALCVTHQVKDDCRLLHAFRDGNRVFECREKT